MGDGIFTVRHGTDAEDKGHSWQKQRKIAAHIFTRQNFNMGMQEVFVNKGHRFCELLAQPAADGNPVDMQQKFFCYTMDSIMEIFFGGKADTLGGAENVYAQAYDKTHQSLVKFVFTSMAFLALSQSLPWPFGTNSGLAARFCEACSPTHFAFRQALKTLHAESHRIVGACRKDPKLAGRRDLLALFVQAEGKENFSDEWLRDVVLNFVIAGRDTTACTLSWLFYILATHPDIQAKVCAEIDEMLPPGAEISTKSLAPSQMPYLNAVLYETLRLYPPVPTDFKEAAQADTLPDGTHVPQYAKLVFSPYVMGRDPARYPDPETVRPERWIPFQEPQPHEFPVFQAGPRICLGMQMAVFEAKVVTSMLLQKYTFEMAPGEAEKIHYLSLAVTMSICNSEAQDSHNLWIVPKARETRHNSVH